MAWAGGVYTRQIAALSLSGTSIWASVKALGRKIRTDDHDNNDNDLATGINSCLNKDGSNAATANLNLGGFRYANAATSNTARTQLAVVAAVQDGALLYSANSDSADVYSITLAPAITSYTDGMEVRGKISATNATGAPTLNVNTVGAKAIVRANGDSAQPGDLLSGTRQAFVYNSSADNFQAQNISAPGSVSRTISTQSGSYTVASTDRGKLINVTSGSGTIDSLSASSAGAGFTFGVKNSGTGTPVFAPVGGIDGITSINMGRQMAIEVISDGSTWRTTAESSLGTQTIGGPAGSWTANSTNGPTAVTIQTGTNTNMIIGYRFSNTTNQNIELLVTAPKGYDRGTLGGRVLSIADSGSGLALYNIAGYMFGSGYSIDQAYGSAQRTVTNYAQGPSAWSIGPEISGITLPGASAGNPYMRIRLTREASDSADTAGTTVVQAADLFYRINRAVDD